LPEGSQFCLKCGEPVRNGGAIAVATGPSPATCAKCGANQPAEAEYCLKCGQRVVLPSDQSISTSTPVPREVLFPPKRRKRNPLPLLFLLVLLAGLTWASLSDHRYALQFQDFVGLTHSVEIADGDLTVGPHNFSSYKIAVPLGATNVDVDGDFKVTAGPHDADNNIETYILTDSAFAIWQNGYSTGSHYESGRVAQGTVDAELPSGAGVYYLVFSNKFSPHAAKNVSANVTLHYKSWLPEWIRLMKDRFLNWVGF
jgi:ribosomal protein L40E